MCQSGRVYSGTGAHVQWACTGAHVQWACTGGGIASGGSCQVMPPDTLDAAEPTADVRFDAIHVQVVPAPQLPTKMSTPNPNALRNLVSEVTGEVVSRSILALARHLRCRLKLSMPPSRQLTYALMSTSRPFTCKWSPLRNFLPE